MNVLVTSEEDVAAVVNNRGSQAVKGRKLNQCLAAVFVTLSAVGAGSVLEWAPSSDIYLHTATSDLIIITYNESSWIEALVPVGAIVGSLPSGFIARRFGPKNTIFSAFSLFLLSWIIIIVASSVGMLYAARIISGLATGAISVVTPIYIGEIAEKSVRGVLGSLFIIMLNFGKILMYSVQNSVNYVWTAAIFTFIPVIYSSTLFLIPESPTYLMKRDGRNEAMKSLQYFRSTDYDIQKEIEDLEIEIHESTQRKLPIKDLLFSPGPRKAFVISVGLMIFQVFCGLHLVLVSLQTVFVYDGINNIKIIILTLKLVEVLVSFVAGSIVDRVGRRILLLISANVMALSLIVLGIYFTIENEDGWFPQICVFTFMGAFSLGFGPIPWVMIGELFSANVKWLGSSIAVCLYWTFVYVIYYVLWEDLYSLGADVLFWSFASVCVVAALFVYFLVPETKRKSVLEIQNMLIGAKVPED